MADIQNSCNENLKHHEELIEKMLAKYDESQRTGEYFKELAE